MGPWRLRVGAGLLVLLAGALAGLVGAPWLGRPAGAPRPPAVADTGVLTRWALPPDRGPWQLKWDALRNQIWFAEGEHASVSLDQLGSLDPATNILREWGVTTNSGLVHGTAIDRAGNLWFTEAFSNTIGRLQPDANAVTLWTLAAGTAAHGIAVDDVVTPNVTIWFTERDQNIVSSLDPATGRYVRYVDPLLDAEPHGITVAADGGSVWFVETCGNRVGQLVTGPLTDTWTFWQPPTTPATCHGGPPVGVGPLFGIFDGADFWYSEGYNDNLIRLHPATNTFTIWHVYDGGVSLLTTQVSPDPDHNLFFTETDGNAVGRLEPVGATTPTVVAVLPTVVTGTVPPAAAAPSAMAVVTPLVTQLTPIAQPLVGQRTGSIVEWLLPTNTPVGSAAGPERGWYGGGAFWIAENRTDKIARFVPSTATPVPGTPSASPTAGGPPATPTPGPPPPSATPAGPTATPCSLSFTDVHPTDYFYTPVLYLACHGVISGYSNGDGTFSFRPYTNTTRAQQVKIVVLGFGIPIQTPAAGAYSFADVPPSQPFFAVIETAAAHQIVSGYACGGPNEPCDTQSRPYFRPYANVTRGQLAKIVVVGAGWALRNPASGSFADVVPGTAFYAFVETAVCHGIISGYACGGPNEPCDSTNRPYFRQYTNATRGQIAKIVYGALTSSTACGP
ncbi:MAG TPA: S-layer homology domain-containing protein [Chloroflexia bacterium]|nr:S-layer homology domain-containing protein [Chloroflexia bacterium]